MPTFPGQLLARGRAIPAYFDFFCGGGLVRTALGASWACPFAVDSNFRKANAYQLAFGPGGGFVRRDVRALTLADLPAGTPDLWWASSPCQDLSVAGPRVGVGGPRSGVLWPVMSLLHRSAADGRAPPLVVLENVAGAMTGRGGEDFVALCTALVSAGYRVGGVVIDAVRFLPVSRVRLFLIAVRDGHPVPVGLLSDGPEAPWHPPILRKAVARLPPMAARRWIWWHLPEPRPMSVRLTDILDRDPPADAWLSERRTADWLGALAPRDATRLDQALSSDGRTLATANRRTRGLRGGGRAQLEPRWDGIAHCMVLPRGGGPSRQLVIDVHGGRARLRQLTRGELARLAGIPDGHALPTNPITVGHIVGEGVAVPAVAWLARHLLDPLAGLPQSADTCVGGANGLLQSGKHEPRQALVGATTLYLLSEERRRLGSLAAALGVSLQELAMAAMDGLLAEHGQPPIARRGSVRVGEPPRPPDPDECVASGTPAS